MKTKISQSPNLGSDVPHSESAVITGRHELGLSWMRCKTPQLSLPMSIRYHPLLAAFLRNLNKLTLFRSHENLALKPDLKTDKIAQSLKTDNCAENCILTRINLMLKHALSCSFSGSYLVATDRFHDVNLLTTFKLERSTPSHLLVPQLHRTSFSTSEKILQVR